MSILITYYAFLVGSVILWTVVRNSSSLSRMRSQCLAFALVAPLMLFIVALNLSYVPSLGLILAFLVFERLVRGPAQAVTEATTRLWLTICLIEAVLPLSLHFALRTNPELERVSLMIAGVVLLAGTLMTFLVFAPDLRKRA
jgi:hypothetical protein